MIAVTPWTQLVRPVVVPPWSGHRDVHVMPGPEESGGNVQRRKRAVRWVPWTLLTAANDTEENRAAARRCWALIEEGRQP